MDDYDDTDDYDDVDRMIDTNPIELGHELRQVRELLRQHVMDFGPEGGCDDGACECSHQRAKRYLHGAGR